MRNLFEGPQLAVSKAGVLNPYLSGIKASTHNRLSVACWTWEHPCFQPFFPSQEMYQNHCVDSHISGSSLDLFGVSLNQLLSTG